jgi:hypothetical protein
LGTGMDRPAVLNKGRIKYPPQPIPVQLLIARRSDWVMNKVLKRKFAEGPYFLFTFPFFLYLTDLQVIVFSPVLKIVKRISDIFKNLAIL